MTYIFIFLCFLGSTNQSPAISHKSLTLVEPKTSWYEKGNQLLELGKWEEALTVWEQGQEQLAQNQLHDPRIGIAYIRLVAQKKLKGNYPQATEYYLWGLKAKPNQKYSSIFKDEIQRLSPIASEEKVDKWTKMLKQQNPKLGLKITRFWAELDPVLSTEFNERIIEHWLRIDYSREHFTRNDDTVYGTDERGIVYVKYGKPDSTHSRTLFFDHTQAYYSARELISKETNQIGGSGVQPLNMGKGGGGFAFIENAGVSRKLTNLAERLHGQPEVTIWVYDQLPNSLWKSTVFIFGKRHNGPFEMLTNLEQLLDGGIYRKLRIGRHKYKSPPLFIAQQQLYESVRDIAPIFRRRLADIQQQIFIPGQEVTLLDAFNLRDQSYIAFNRSYLSASKEASLFKNNIPELPTRITQYRMIDPSSNEPYILTSVFAYPLKPAATDVLMDYSEDKSFNISTVYQSDALTKETQKAHYDLNNLDENASLVTVFRSPHTQMNQGALVSSELSRPKIIKDYRGLETNIKAINKLDLKLPNPLETNATLLEMSDLIIGYSKAPNQQHIPFKVTPDNKIPKNENLKIRFEVYHLKKNGAAPTSVNIDYSVKPIEGFFKRLFSNNKNQVSLSLNFETMKTSLNEVLEVSTQNFSPGDYELTLVANGNGGQSVKRTVKFSIGQK